MAWTNPPKTWSSGELVTAAIQNQEIRDQFKSVQGAVISKSAGYTIVEGDFAGGVLTCLVDTTGGSDITIVLPAVSGLTGFQVTVILAAATYTSGASTGTVIVDGSGSEVINGLTTTPLYLQNDFVTVVCDGTGWKIINERCSLLAEYTLVGTLTFPHNTWTPLRYDTANVDTASCLGTTGDSDGSFIVPAGMAGYYELLCAFRWATSATWTITPAGFFSQFFKGVTGGATLAEFQAYMGNYHTKGRINNTMVAQPLLAAGDYISPSSKQVTGVEYTASVLPERQMFWARLVKRTYA